jgi:hypothetical protein
MRRLKMPIKTCEECGKQVFVCKACAQEEEMIDAEPKAAPEKKPSKRYHKKTITLNLVEIRPNAKDKTDIQKLMKSGLSRYLATKQVQAAADLNKGWKPNKSFRDGKIPEGKLDLDEPVPEE